MFRKLVILLLIGGGIAYATSHTRVGRHVVTLFDRTTEQIEDGIAPDVEISTMKRELRKLEAEQVKIQGRYAASKVDAERLAVVVMNDRRDLEAAELVLMKRGEEIKKATETNRVSWNGITVSASEAKERLQTAVDQFKARKGQLAADERRLGYLEKDRDTLGQQVSSFRAEMARLHGEIARLQAETNLLKAEQISNRRPRDGSDLSELKESIEKLCRKIAIEREKLNLAQDRISGDASGKSVDEILSGLKEKEAAREEKP